MPINLPNITKVLEKHLNIGPINNANQGRTEEIEEAKEAKAVKEAKVGGREVEVKEVKGVAETVAAMVVRSQGSVVH